MFKTNKNSFLFKNKTIILLNSFALFSWSGPDVGPHLPHQPAHRKNILVPSLERLKSLIAAKELPSVFPNTDWKKSKFWLLGIAWKWLYCTKGWLVCCILLNVHNISLIWGSWRMMNLYRSTPAVTRGLGFLRSHPKDFPNLVAFYNN